MTISKVSYQRKSAFIGGTFILIMALVSSFSYGFVHGKLVVPDDATTTFNNLMSSKNLFKAEIFGWLIILISDILVAWAFYIFLKSIDKSLSLLGAFLRLTYAGILGIAILNLLFVVLLTKNTDYLSLLNMEQLKAHVMLFFDAFELIWSIGLMIFGAHLMIVGYLAFKSDIIPKFISILLLLASVGYIVINLFKTFLPQFEGIIFILNIVFSIPMIGGELGLGIWLLFKGRKVNKSV